MKRWMIIPVLGLFLSVGAYAAPTEKDAAKANNEFGVGLFNKVTKETAKGNKFLSPVSAYFALSMLYNGAQKETATELAELLASKGVSLADFNTANRQLLTSIRSDKGFTLALANSLWVRKGAKLRDAFVDTAKSVYDAPVTELDFKLPTAAGIINSWVKVNTGNKIDSIVPPVLPVEAVLYLINATYFQADWETKFNPYNTVESDFTKADGKVVELPMLNSSRKSQFKLVTLADGTEAVSLPYKGGAVSMLVLLPPEKVKPADVVAKLGAPGIADAVEQLDKAKSEEVHVQLPKLDFAYEETLNDSLKALGMKRSFDESKAQLKGIVSNSLGNEFVSNVKQKTFIQVDEEGTKAGAATSVEVSTRSFSKPPKPFIVDRPYAFAIVENRTGALLFLGSINEPEGGKMPETEKLRNR